VFGLPAPADVDAPCVPAEACALAVTATADAEASNSNLPPVNLSYAALFSKKMTCRYAARRPERRT
jgi:hypothetical protein